MQTNEREKLIQNLKDCSCDDDMIDSFMESYDSGRVKDALRILAKHRDELLDRFHKCSDNIGCLDYLVHQIESRKV